MADICRDALKNRQTIFLCGNGGSAADSQHIAAEFVIRYVKNRRALPAIALTTDTSVLTSCGNDFGFETIYQRQVEALVREGDVVIGISTSGNSNNVILALEEAKKIGAKTIGMTGAKIGKIDDIVDCCLKVPSTVTGRIQECHILVGHMVCQYVEEDYENVQK